MDSSVTSSHMLSEGFTCLKYVNLNKLDKNLLLKFSKQFSRGHALSLDSSGQHQHRPLSTFIITKFLHLIFKLPPSHPSPDKIISYSFSVPGFEGEYEFGRKVYSAHLVEGQNPIGMNHKD